MQEGIFINRPNRFLAFVRSEGKIVKCHVKNTGRLGELLKEGTMVYIQHHNDPKRKTEYSLIHVKKGNQLVNIDSQAPNKIVGEWLASGGMGNKFTIIKPEKKFGDSRFDFYLERDGKKAYMEVKGVTLEIDGTAKFPDAPTERGVKHIRELIEAVKKGYDAYIVFVIQLKGVTCFSPNDMTQPEFGDAIRQAQKEGVQILAFDCIVEKNRLEIDKKIPVILT